MFCNIKLRPTILIGIVLHFCQCDEFRFYNYRESSVDSPSITIRGFEVHKMLSKHKGLCPQFQPWRTL